MSNRVLNIHTTWRCNLLGAAMAGSLLASSAGAWAALPPSAAAPAGNTTASKLVADAQKAMQSGNLRLALINLKNAVNAEPGNGAVRAQLGIGLIQIGDVAGAERELRQARKDGAPELIVLPPLFQVMLSRGEFQLLLNQFPDPGPAPKEQAAADILKGRALAFQGLKRQAEAVDAMDRSLALRRDSMALLSRARLALVQNNVPEARKFIDEAIQKSGTPDAMLFKIGILLSSNDPQGAMDLSNQLLAKFPGNIQGRFGRIEAYLALKQDAKAKAEVDDITAKYPTASMGIYYRALLLARAGDTKGAWNVAQNLSPEFRDSQPRIAMLSAQMAINAGNDETAASILNRLLAKNPDSAPARESLASIRLKQNNPGEALEVLDPIKNSTDFRVVELLANVYIKLNRRDDALNALKKLDTTGPGNNNVKRSIALLEIGAGQTEQGIKDLSQIVSQDPTNLSLVDPLITVLTQARRFPEALAVVDRLGADPKLRSTALVYRGGVLVAQNDRKGAQAAFDKAVLADPRNIQALLARANFLAVVGKPAEANRDLRAALALDSKNMAAFLKLAEIAAQQGQDQNVRSVLAQAIAAAPSNAQPRIVLARYLIARRDFDNAVTAAGDLVRTQPKSNEGLTLLGQAQLGSGQKKEAIATYRRLALQMPTSATPQVLLGEALASSGDGAGAARAMETAVKLDPVSAQVRSAQIHILLSQKNNSAAVAAARAFQASSPGTEADILLADTLASAQLPDQAAQVLNKSLADRPNPIILLRLVRVALQTNDAKRAGDLMSNWLASHPADGAVRLEYATLLMQENSPAAIAQYQTILKQSPDNVLALNNLGWMLQDSDPKSALAMLTKAYKLAPNSANVADTLGWIKFQQKDAAGALTLLDRAHALQPRDGQITYHLALALNANAKRNEARGLLKSLLASNAQFKDRPAAVQLSNSWH